jgi:TPR repeat protein
MLYAYVLSYDSRYAKPFQEIIKWLHAAAEKNISAAQKELGFVYANGLGVSRNYAGAVKWYRKAADQGDAEAQCAMGSCYEEGLGVSQDYAEAVKWYHKAVELGSPIAQTCLGGCYKDGHGVPQSYPEALNWYRKAAEQGYAQGQFDVGACYYNGQGVSKDRAEAIKWFRKAAEQDYALAQKTLSQLGESWQSPVDKRFGPPLSANSIKKPPGFEKPIEVQIPVNLITGTPFLNPFIVATRTKSATVSRNGSVDVLFCSKIAPLLNGANQGAVAMPERIPVATMLFLVYAKLGQIAGVWALQNGKQELLMSSNARWEGMLFCGNQVCSVRFSHDPPLSAPYFIKLPEGSFIWDKIDEFMQFPEPRWSAIIRFAGGGDSNDSSH